MFRPVYGDHLKSKNRNMKSRHLKEPKKNPKDRKITTKVRQVCNKRTERGVEGNRETRINSDKKYQKQIIQTIE